jgi:hypothetical protein
MIGIDSQRLGLTQTVRRRGTAQPTTISTARLSAADWR